MSVTLFSACKSMPQKEIDNAKFTNSELEYKSGLGDIWKISKAYFKAKRDEPTPVSEMPLSKISATELTQNTGSPRLYRLGHSSMLLQLAGENILIAPVFSERASPVQWAGPKRFHPVPLDIADLPPIKAVVISHDHYDHLDKATIKKLHGKVEHFITPLKVGQYLKGWGVDSSKIFELDWWQNTPLGQLQFTATPAQHFSGRGLLDRNKTLWAGWAIKSPEANIFFSGDSGYFSGFKEIGERLGPFDLTMIETGAYNRLWQQIHMLPEQSVQAHIDLQGKAMLPIHNSTFDLALHDWQEPLERAYQAAEEQGVKLVTPVMGEAISINNPPAAVAWWREESMEVTSEVALAN